MGETDTTPQIQPPDPPGDLQDAGCGLWRRVTADFDLGADELAVLAHACRCEDELDMLRAAALRSDVIVKGSRGQPTVSAVFDELRKHRGTLASLLKQLALPDEDDGDAGRTRRGWVSPTMAHTRAKKAANARWHPNG